MTRIRLLICTSLVFLAAPGAASSQPASLPRTFTAIHCDPQYANPFVDWPALAQIVAAANSRNLKLCLQFAPQWAAMILADSTKVQQLRLWEIQGHEVAGHHHTLDHPVAWDGYSDDPAAPDTTLWPGFLGDMQKYINVVSGLAAPGAIIKTVSSKDADFPPGVPFQTGGDTGGSVEFAISRPTLRNIDGDLVWQIDHAAIVTGTTWHIAEFESVYALAGADDVFGIAVHPQDYYDPTPLDAWFDFLVQQDPLGTRSRTPCQILTVAQTSTPPVDATSKPDLTLHPNPFSRGTQVSFGLTRPAAVRLTVHDVAGRTIATLARGRREKGRHSMWWAGLDASGAPVGPGVYLLRLEAAGEVRTEKVVRLR